MNTQHSSLACNYWNATFSPPESQALEAAPTIPTPQPLGELGYKHRYVHSRDQSALGVLTVPLKPRDWRAVGGQRERSVEQVNFTDY